MLVVFALTIQTPLFLVGNCKEQFTNILLTSRKTECETLTIQ